MKISLKNIDFIFLTFLLLLTQGSIQLKIIAIFIILILRLRALAKVHKFSFFYFFIIIFHLVFGLFILIFSSYQYVSNYLLTLMFWMISFITLAQIAYFTKKHTLKTCLKTIDAFFLINVIVVFFQLLGLTYKFQSINPYGVTTSAGDFISSIYSNSSVNAMVMSFFCVLYFVQKKKKLGFLALIILLMTTYMSGLVIFLCSTLLSLFLFSRIKLKHKALIVITSFMAVIVFKQVSPNNVTYVTRYLNRIVKNDDNVPFKIKSFRQTFQYSTSSVSNFIFGAGGGNFSSRVAFIASGDYVSWYPDNLVYTSKEFQKYHLGIWNYDFNNPWDNRNNTANQPFSCYNQIIGEYGLIGVLLFIIFYGGYLYSNRKYLLFTKYAIICLLLYFVLDYWFEYFSVIVIFELLVMLDIKTNKIKEENTNLETT
jgi:hypothetical protein